MPDVRWQVFAAPHELDLYLADELAVLLADAIAARGCASLVVSGGSTPIGMFRTLAMRNLAWDRVTVTLADERWVPGDHPDSNERLVREHLITGKASAAHFVSLRADHERPETAEELVCARLQSLGTFDAVVLGMGADGHFASLFPGSSALERGLAPGAAACLAVDPPSAPHARMSLSLSRLAATRRLFLHIVGEEKRAVLNEAAALQDPTTLPVAAVLALDSPPVEVFWSP